MPSLPDQQRMSEFFRRRYPDGLDKRVKVREFIHEKCGWFVDAGLADDHFVEQLCSGQEVRFWQRLSEVLLAFELFRLDLPISSDRRGPDYLVEHEGRRIWIEVVCPEPNGIPDDWLHSPFGKVVGLPDRAILLRWTTAIDEKWKKLVGNPAKGEAGYRAGGLVRDDDAYVIAVNGRQLRDWAPQLEGLSGLPFAVEATLGVGYRQIHIDRATRAATGADHQYRTAVAKPSSNLPSVQSVPVPAAVFWDDAWSPVSAIWAADLDDTHILGNHRPLAVIHNPKASVPIPPGLLPAFDEFVAEAVENSDEFNLTRHSGRLSGPEDQADR